MSPSLTFLERCRADTGFQVDVLEKVVRLGELAADVARHPFLGPSLALKGGTALNLAFGEPSRLSVDLDFNYIANVDRAVMLRDRPQVEAAVTELARRHGYRVQHSSDAFAGRKLHLTYRSVLGPDDRIEVDLNYLMRLPLGAPEQRSLWQPGGLDRPTLRVVSLNELLVGKLLAFLDRAAPRDVWDVAHLPAADAAGVGTVEFRRWFIGMAAVLPSLLYTYSRDRLEAHITERVLTEQLLPMLIAGTPVSAAKLIDQAWTAVAPLLDLTETERAYLDAFNTGDLTPEALLSSDPNASAVIAAHPAIQWRLQNIREHRARQRPHADRA
jgi:predicted nucleotidyltransferase component of viral defense system